MDREAYNILHEVEEGHWWFRGRRKVLDNLLKRIISKQKTAPLILDIGCSVGITLSSLKKHGRVCGVDIYNEALRFCKKDSTMVIQADACDLPFFEESCDLLIALDLLEHLREDAKGIKEFRRVLKKNGYLIASVPAYKALWSDFDIYAQHFRRYSLKELKNKISKEEFEIQKVFYVNFFLFLGILIGRLYRKIFGRNASCGSDLRLPPTMINMTLEKVSMFEAGLINKLSFPFGSSIFCIARKI